MRKLAVFFLVFLIASGGFGQSLDTQIGQNTLKAEYKKTKIKKSGSEQKFYPIEIQHGGADKRPTQNYYYKGLKLESFQQLKAVLDPLNDPEADRLLRSSADNDNTGMAFLVEGGLLCAAGFIYEITAKSSLENDWTVTKPGFPR